MKAQCTTAFEQMVLSMRQRLRPTTAYLFADRLRTCVGLNYSRGYIFSKRVSSFFGDGRPASRIASRAWPPASSTAFVISSTKSGMPSVRSIMSNLMLAGSDRAAVDWPTSRYCTHHQPAW